MEKSLIFLLIVGIILGAGIALSFYGAQLTTQDIIVKEERVASGSSVDVSVELDPKLGETGVYAVLVNNFDEDSISISLYDPFGSKILSSIVDKESTEERFEIVSDGTYKLEIENSGLEEYQIVAGTLSVGFTGFYLTIVGLIGIVGVGFYAIKNRQKNKLS
jgi:hypothetical protein